MMLSFTDDSLHFYKSFLLSCYCNILCHVFMCFMSHSDDDDDCKDINEGSLCLHYFPHPGFHEMFLLVKLWISFYIMCG